MVADAMALFDANSGSTYEDEQYYPPKWNEVHAQRRRTVGWDLYGLLGIKKGERDKTRVQHARNYRLFDAPVGLFFFTNTYLERGSWLDIGLLIETVMLAARGFGLHTCPQACWIPHAETVRKSVGAPNDQVLACGMALGYEDTNAVENTLVSERESFDNFVTMKGFGSPIRRRRTGKRIVTGGARGPVAHHSCRFRRPVWQTRLSTFEVQAGVLVRS